MSKTVAVIVVSVCMLACSESGDADSPRTSNDSGMGGDGERDAGTLDRDGEVADGASFDAGDAGSDVDGGSESDAGAKSDAGEPMQGEHCSPGVAVPASEFARQSEPNHAWGCFNDKYAAAGAAGLFATPPKVDLAIYDIELAVPMTAVQPYAASFEVSYQGKEGEFQLELWGTMGACGQGSTAERLFAAPIAQGTQTVCAQVTATTPYTHWLLVRRDIDDVRGPAWTVALGGASFCATGQCR